MSSPKRFDDVQRTSVIEDFKKDLEVASRDLDQLGQTQILDDVIFYASVPLAIAGIITQLPIKAVFSICVGGSWKIVKRQKRKQLDWLLFGRS